MHISVYIAPAWVSRRVVLTWEPVRTCHSGSHLLSHSNHILMSAVEHVALSPTNSRVTKWIDLLDICLTVVVPEFHCSICHTHTDTHTSAAAPAHVHTYSLFSYKEQLQTHHLHLSSVKSLCLSLEWLISCAFMLEFLFYLLFVISATDTGIRGQ